MTKTILIQWNEVGENIFETYIGETKDKFLALHKLYSMQRIKTTSEIEYEKLEPWIQWASAYTDKPFHEHKIFRLGDAKYYQQKMLLNRLIDEGKSVTAVCPMNHKYPGSKVDFFLPDPWTMESSKAPWLFKKVFGSIRKIVNNHVHGKPSFHDMFIIIVAIIFTCNFQSLKSYALAFLMARKFSGAKALILDILLTDIFLRSKSRYDSDFNCLFLNGLAHVQHKYMKNSKLNHSSEKNPTFLVSSHVDPVYEALIIYDRIFMKLFSRVDSQNENVIVASGLSQKIYPDTTYYYRLKNHKAFFNLLGFTDLTINERMTRDFEVVAKSEASAKEIQVRLESLCCDNLKIFGDFSITDNRLFCSLVYPNLIHEDDYIENTAISLREFTSFVAIKNGMHDGNGIILHNLNDVDTPSEIKIWELGALIDEAYAAQS